MRGARDVITIRRETICRSPVVYMYSRRLDIPRWRGITQAAGWNKTGYQVQLTQGLPKYCTIELHSPWMTVPAQAVPVVNSPQIITTRNHYSTALPYCHNQCATILSAQSFSAPRTRTVSTAVCRKWSLTKATPRRATVGSCLRLTGRPWLWPASLAQGTPGCVGYWRLPLGSAPGLNSATSA